MTKLTIGALTNLCSHAWEMQRNIGFYMQDVTTFRQHIIDMPARDLSDFMENLGLFFSITRAIGEVAVELKVDGAHPMYAPLCQTKIAHELGVDENLVTTPPVPKSQAVLGA